MFTGLPWEFYSFDTIRFWVHYGLVILGFVLAVITVAVQFVKPAPKHESIDVNWGVPIPKRFGHIISDAVPGVLMVTLVFFSYGNKREYINYVFLGIWLLHYCHRAIVLPMNMRRRSNLVPLGIILGGFLPNCLFHFLNADFIGNANFDDSYYNDSRFIVGLLVFILGYIINRWADFKMRSRGQTEGCTGYNIPFGWLFELIPCPYYLGELVLWLGWSLATFSPAGLGWTLFAAATIIPRSRHNHNCFNMFETLQAFKWMVDHCAKSLSLASADRNFKLNNNSMQEMVDTDDLDDVDSIQDDIRREANLLYRKRHECFQKSQEAFRQGQKQLASTYSKQGHMLTKKMEEANQRASEKILAERHDDLTKYGKLDLHNLYVDEAIAALNRILPDLKKDNKRKQLVILTGRGSHSPGGIARLRPAVHKYLEDLHYMFTEERIGVFNVTLNRGQ